MKKDRIAIEARDDAKRSISSLRAPDPRPTHAHKTRSLSLSVHGFRVERWRRQTVRSWTAGTFQLAKPQS